jgi:hypothetical protein
MTLPEGQLVLGVALVDFNHLVHRPPFFCIATHPSS